MAVAIALQAQPICHPVCCILRVGLQGSMYHFPVWSSICLTASEHSGAQRLRPLVGTDSLAGGLFSSRALEGYTRSATRQQNLCRPSPFHGRRHELEGFD